MRKKILKALKKLELEKQIKILYACETGSRAWGFASSNSDFDVRFIYVHKLDWYLSINQKKDNIAIMLEDRKIDLLGWELRKTLNLMKKSNASLFEKLDSPEVYIQEQNFLERIKKFEEDMFSPITVLYHYLSMCKTVFAAVENQEEYSLKKLLYALRTALASKWVLEKKVKAPMVFQTIINELDIDFYLKKRLFEIIELKRNVDEKYVHKGDTELINLVRNIINNVSANANKMSGAKNKDKDLDAFFRDMVIV